MEEIGQDSRGHRLYRDVSEVGSNRYWSDEIGGGVLVWDTALVSPEMMRLALAKEDEVLAAASRQRLMERK